MIFQLFQASLIGKTPFALTSTLANAAKLEQQTGAT